MKLRAIAPLSLLALTWAASAWATPLAEAGTGLPRDASLDGYRVDYLLKTSSVGIALLFVIMVGIIVWAMLKHRAPHKAHYDHGVGRHNAMMAMAISGSIFFGLDGWLFYHSMRDIGEAFWNFPTAETPGVLRVEVNAQQWAWNFRYAGPDGQWNTKDDVVTLNDLRIPIDTPVHFELASKDVIHSFYLPNFRVKQDAIPGNITQMWTQAAQTGEFDIACAQHCGTHHYKMKGTLKVLSKEDFARWTAEQSAESARAFDEAHKDQQWGWAWEKI